MILFHLKGIGTRVNSNDISLIYSAVYSELFWPYMGILADNCNTFHQINDIYRDEKNDRTPYRKNYPSPTPAAGKLYN